MITKKVLIIASGCLLVGALFYAVGERIREGAIGVMVPFMRSAEPHQLEWQQLKLHHQRLLKENERLRAIVAQGYALTQANRPLSQLNERHRLILTHCLRKQVQALPAQVIHRSSAAWNSSLWLNVGSADNLALGHEVVAKNSPVTVGSSIIGVVDEVGLHRCRVRLITDSGLNPAVRVVRGGMQQRALVNDLALLIERMKQSVELFPTSEEKKKGLQQLKEVYQGLAKAPSKDTLFLAKGELQGSAQMLWRGRSKVLKGVGFNYDYADEEGPARNLRTGYPEGTTQDAIPILQVNDLLVTSGLDGVFPAGLSVAEVTRVKPLKEGDYSYELEAVPTAGNLDELNVVFVMPPVAL